MCSNYTPISDSNEHWVNEHFNCSLPDTPWRKEAYPTYLGPFIFLDEGKPKCELAEFGLCLMDHFYEPNWETGKAIRWSIKRTDLQPVAVASIWERFTDKETGEIVFSFSLLTINADHHPVMKHFHKPNDEKRSIVVLQDNDYAKWLNANHNQARDLLTLAPNDFLASEPSPR